MAQRSTVLVVDDHPDMTRLLVEELGEAGFDVIEADSGARALALADLRQPDVVVTDLRMAGVDGFDVLEGLHRLDPELPVVIMTAFGSIDSAVEAMQRGAFSYLAKPFRVNELLLQVERALALRALHTENRSLRRLVDPPDGMVGSSSEMQTVRARIARLADAAVPVLVRGETGTGKERVARALHFSGARRSRPFVALNCASVPSALLESELFGHVRGAFTGATGARRGLFVEADGGTLFLDEIGDMPLLLQGHLLRVLEDGIVRPVGADTGRAVDVRIVAATHQDLEASIAAGRFRSDLYFRLDVVPIVVPPLRSRTTDLPELFRVFVERCAPTPIRQLAPDALAVLERHAWPGNVRELENLVRRLAVLVDHPQVTVADLALHAPSVRVGAEAPSASQGLVSLREHEDDYIAHVIDWCGGNKTQAAAILGIDVSTVHRRFRS